MGRVLDMQAGMGVIFQKKPRSVSHANSAFVSQSSQFSQNPLKGTIIPILQTKRQVVKQLAHGHSQ